MKNFLITIILLLSSLSFAFSQNNYPKGYFVLPINPGTITSLSGCFGDIRTNHFHSGLDIRTGGVEGKKVVAAADGYVSRIRVQNGGYGNVLYITHPNGYTTVYAHLKEFNKELNQYLTQKQYEQKTWVIDVEVPQGMFNYRQGEMVALSGNTGGSAGPHLHFEIRDPKENTIDPRLFGFKEIKDIISPTIDAVILKCLSKEAAINGKFGIFTFTPTRRGNSYSLPNIKANGLIGVEILTYDKVNNSPFRMGVYKIDLDYNGESVFKFDLEKMSFNNKEDMNVHINYEKFVKNNQKIHKCYVEESNSMDFYTTSKNWGKLSVDNPSNKVNIKVIDSYGNTSTLNFNLLKSDGNSEYSKYATATVLDRFLKITGPGKEISLNTADGRTINLPLSKSSSGTISTVYDMDLGFPQMAFIDNNPVDLPVNTAITLNKPRIETQNLRANFSGTLYDNAYVYVNFNDESLTLHEDYIPLKGYANIEWTKTGAVNYPEKQKVYLDGKKRKFIGGEWDGKTIKFKTREFGTYLTLYDFDPPSITPRIVNKDKLRFTISDKLSGINKIECFVNGEWILMDYEYKTGAIWSRKLEENKPFSGNLVLKITDNCNNTESYETNIP